MFEQPTQDDLYPDGIEVVNPEDLPHEDEGDFDPCEESTDAAPLTGGALGFGTTSRHVLATWLPAAFKKWGVRYKLVDGWENRGRPISVGYFDPNGSLTHHTGTRSSASNPAPSLRTVIEGRSDLSGPLCQVSTDYNGLTYIVAAGRANHAGKARATMGNPAGDGNAMYLGNEVQTSGLQKMPDAQYEAVVLVAAAIADHFRQTSASKVGLHATTSLSGKWDLGAGTGAVAPYDITKFRADVAARLKAGPPVAPAPAPTTEGDSMSAADVAELKDYLGKVLITGYTSEGKSFPGLAKVDIENQSRLTKGFADVQLQLAGVSAALEALAKAQGVVDPAEVVAVVDRAVRDRLDRIDFTVTDAPEVQA